MTHPNLHHGTHRLLPFPFPPLGVGGLQVVTGDYLLAGWAIVETTGAAAAQVELYDGQNNGGVLVGVLNLAQGTSGTAFFGGHLLHLNNGLFVNVVAGSVKGVAYAADV
jgi:hypothetical protein